MQNQNRHSGPPSSRRGAGIWRLSLVPLEETVIITPSDIIDLLFIDSYTDFEPTSNRALPGQKTT